MVQSFIMLFVSMCAIASVTSVSVSTVLSDDVAQFLNWTKKYDVLNNIDTPIIDLFTNWLSNHKYIQEINALQLSYTLGHNKYSGYNSTEFSAIMRFQQNRQTIGIDTTYGDNVEPQYSKSILDSLDWRDKDVVSEIRDQGQCGSCWAFSGTSTLESAIAIKEGVLLDLSEQQSVSCATIRNGYSNMGCNGGMYDSMWEFVSDMGGLCLEQDYTYSSGVSTQTGTCKQLCDIVAGTKVIDYEVVTPYSDTAMMQSLMVSPVSIAIQADTRTFQLYNGGVYTDYSGCGGDSPELDHAVVLVGYGTTVGGEDYYIMRNSWGTSWGDMDTKENNGYMLMGRGEEFGSAGMCGLLSTPMYPIV